MPNKTRMMPTKLDRFQITGIQFNTNVPKECHLEIIAKAGENILQLLQKVFCNPGIALKPFTGDTAKSVTVGQSFLIARHSLRGKEIEAVHCHCVAMRANIVGLYLYSSPYVLYQHVCTGFNIVVDYFHFQCIWFLQLHCSENWETTKIMWLLNICVTSFITRQYPKVYCKKGKPKVCQDPIDQHCRCILLQ